MYINININIDNSLYGRRKPMEATTTKKGDLLYSEPAKAFCEKEEEKKNNKCNRNDVKISRCTHT